MWTTTHLFRATLCGAGLEVAIYMGTRYFSILYMEFCWMGEVLCHVKGSCVIFLVFYF